MLRLWQLEWLKFVRRLIGVAVAVTALSIGACSQCAKGVVAIHGRVEKLVADVGEVNVKVVLRTPKGDFSNTAGATNGQFSVDVPFNTLKSWSALSGHHCSNVPKSVDVTVVAADHILAHKVLDFKDSFETHDSVVYQVKHELVLDAER